jgi:hypothetical protein
VRKGELKERQRANPDGQGDLVCTPESSTGDWVAVLEISEKPQPAVSLQPKTGAAF